MATDNETATGFRFYSLGIVVYDKEEGSDYIEVTPIEDFPMELGRLSDRDRIRKATIQSISGTKKTSEIQGGSSVKAKWVPLADPNRDNAPDVYQTETVILYKYSDTQDYYWSTIFREPRLRGKERYRISLSNKDPGGEGYDSDTSYWLEIDTKYKQIRLHTSDNDGEPTTYDLLLDTKNGRFSFEDKLGNSIFLDSVAGDLTTTTENSVTVNTKYYTVNASESYTINTKRYIKNASESSTSETPKDSLIAEESEVVGTTHEVKSLLKANEGFDLSGDAGGGNATAKLKGNLNVDGDIDATGTIMDGGGNSNHHSH